MSANTTVLLAALLILFIYHVAVVCLKERRIKRHEKTINDLFCMVNSTQAIAGEQSETMRKQIAKEVYDLLLDLKSNTGSPYTLRSLTREAGKK